MRPTVGIVTLWAADNPGACLQAKALICAIHLLGADAYLIDEDHGISFPVRTPPVLKNAILERHGRFEKFRKLHLPIAAADSYYDTYLAGSDQIWNKSIANARLSRFALAGISSAKRASYAASFGGTPPPPLLARELSHMSYLSVRDVESRTFCRNYLKRDAVVDLDPTLLVNPSVFLDLPPCTAPTLTLALAVPDQSLITTATRLAQERELELRILTNQPIPTAPISVWAETGPLEWASAIAAATIVATNSYHGLALAIALRKPCLFAFLKGDLQPRNARFNELTAFAKNKSAYNNGSAVLFEDYDYDRLREMRTSSREHLQQALNL